VSGCRGSGEIECPTCLGHKQLLFSIKVKCDVANPEFSLRAAVNEASARLVAEQDKAVKGQRVIRQRHRAPRESRSECHFQQHSASARPCFSVYGFENGCTLSSSHGR
uniref:Kinesin motor domain-containing protein n=1 Tax=Macrostomum lignano TaxID=282301 RepID=A0A1I8FBC5_9PLAT